MQTNMGWEMEKYKKGGNGIFLPADKKRGCGAILYNI
jgi:hypothetical protein